MSNDPTTSYAAIPTQYSGVNMRSRLEAKWCAMFDACKLPWSYEPLELRSAEGTVMIPDFVLNTEIPLMIECKPASTLAELVPHREKLHAHAYDWMRTGVEEDFYYQSMKRELEREESVDDSDLTHIDYCAERMIARTTRHAIVVGSQPVVVPGAMDHDVLTLDGELGFIHCYGMSQYDLNHPATNPKNRPSPGPHVGIADVNDGLVDNGSTTCLVCGGGVTPSWESSEYSNRPGCGYWIPASRMLGFWKSACNAIQWRPPIIPTQDGEAK